MKLQVNAESWPIAGNFTISRGSKTMADVVVVSLHDGTHQGRGESVPYSRYNETIPQVLAAFEHHRPTIEQGISRDKIADLQLPKAAANALDCALWDLEAKKTGQPVWKRAGFEKPQDILTAYTLSLDTPQAMASAATAAAHRPLLKLKLGGDGDAERLRLIRKAAPDAKLIVDANEGWTPTTIIDLLSQCADVGVIMVEQPLPASQDGLLSDIERPVPVCADESAHDIHSLPGLVGKYDAINIKLDKTGGLTPALQMATAAQEMNLRIMVGCMLATSLAMAPALLLAQYADIVDLDGPLLLQSDRKPGLEYRGSVISPASADLWG